jgi:transposase
MRVEVLRYESFISGIRNQGMQQRVAQPEEINAALQQRITWFEEQFRLSQQRRFGAAHEGSDALQLPLFNEAEHDAADALAPVVETITYERKKKTPGQRAVAWNHLPVERVEYRLPEADQVCPQCGGPLHEMGADVRQELEVIPAQLKVREHVRYRYACRHCERCALTTPVRSAPMPPPVYPGSFASASLLAYTLHQKYVAGLPLYRQSQEWARLGLSLSRQTLANWVLYAAHEWLRPLYGALRAQLWMRDILQADETTVQVLQEPDRRAQSPSYMWLYRSGRDGPAIVLYDYQRSRSGDHPRRFLEGFRGYLHVDGYAGYRGLPDAILVGCWAHARRKFTDALKSLPAAARDGPSAIREGLEYCNRLFAIERTVQAADPAVRYRVRTERSRPVLAQFAWWLRAHRHTALPKSPLGEAIAYCLNQWTALPAFLLAGRLELDNNRSERSIKPFVLGRNYALQPVMC